MVLLSTEKEMRQFVNQHLSPPFNLFGSWKGLDEQKNHVRALKVMDVFLRTSKEEVLELIPASMKTHFMTMICALKSPELYVEQDKLDQFQLILKQKITSTIKSEYCYQRIISLL